MPPPAVGDRMAHDEGIAGAKTKSIFPQRVYEATRVILESRCRHRAIVTHGALTFVGCTWITMSIESTDYVLFRVPPGSTSVLSEDDYFHNRTVAELGEYRSPRFVLACDDRCCGAARVRRCARPAARRRIAHAGAIPRHHYP